MAPARLAALGVALLALALPAQALAGSVGVKGSGTLSFQTRRSATTFATTVMAPARIRLITTGAARFRPVCVVDNGRRCVRYDAQHKQWVVLRPVKFFYSGSAFRLIIRTRKAFDVGITGKGRLNLQGKGTYTQGGATHDYNGEVQLQLV